MIEIGNQFKVSFGDDIFTVTHVSKTGSSLKAVSSVGGKKGFRWYNASGNYIMNGTPNTTIDKWYN